MARGSGIRDPGTPKRVDLPEVKLIRTTKARSVPGEVYASLIKEAIGVIQSNSLAGGSGHIVR